MRRLVSESESQLFTGDTSKDNQDVRSFVALLAEGFRLVVVDVVMLFYVHDKHLRSCQDGQLT